MDEVLRRKRKHSQSDASDEAGGATMTGDAAATGVSGTDLTDTSGRQAAAGARATVARSSASTSSPLRRNGSPRHLSPLHPPSDDEDEVSSSGSRPRKSQPVPMRRSARASAGSADRIAPMSPTDVLLSPVSRMLSGRLTSVHKRQRRFMIPAVEAGAGAASASRAVKHPQPLNRGSLLPRAPPPVEIVLGTSSEARHKVMRELGLSFQVMKPDIDEKAVRDPDPLELPVVIALAKAKAMLERVPEHCKYLITADQVVLMDGVAYEKPSSIAEAKAFMSKFSTSKLQSVSAVVVVDVASGSTHHDVDIVDIEFEAIPEADMDAAIAGGSGDVMWCCGALCIEHPAIAPHVRAMHGPLDSVFGLPKLVLARLLRGAGYRGSFVGLDEAKLKGEGDTNDADAGCGTTAASSPVASSDSGSGAGAGVAACGNSGARRSDAADGLRADHPASDVER